MKLKEKLAQEIFWGEHPIGALLIQKESWCEGFVRGFEKAREMSLQTMNDVPCALFRLRDLGEEENK